MKYLYTCLFIIFFGHSVWANETQYNHIDLFQSLQNIQAKTITKFYYFVDDQLIAQEDYFEHYNESQFYVIDVVEFENQEGEECKATMCYSSQETYENRQPVSYFSEQHDLPITQELIDQFDVAVENSDTMPEYPGGWNNLKKTIMMNFDYSDSFLDGEVEKGRIVINFVVSKDGSIRQVELSQGLDFCEECNRNAIRAVQLVKQKFSPATKNGKPVSVRYTLPITMVK